MRPKKYPSGNWGTQNKNINHGNDILARRDRLSKSLVHFVSIGDLCQAWASEIAKREGLVNV
jgi:hypothetical protein